MAVGDELLRAVRQRRQGAVLVLTGPPGIGKTHAARALLQRAAVRTLEVPATLSLAAWPTRLPAVRGLPVWVEAALRRLPEDEGAIPALAASLTACAPLTILMISMTLLRRSKSPWAAWPP